ncbi:MAG: hypothetical protein ACRD2P_03430, partial [Terriglobia bacterium]
MPQSFKSKTLRLYLGFHPTRRVFPRLESVCLHRAPAPGDLGAAVGLITWKHDASNRKQKAKQGALLMDQKQTEWEEEMGGKRGLKNKKGLFYFFQVIENKESKPER